MARFTTPRTTRSGGSTLEEKFRLWLQNQEFLPVCPLPEPHGRCCADSPQTATGRSTSQPAVAVVCSRSAPPDRSRRFTSFRAPGRRRRLHYSRAAFTCLNICKRRPRCNQKIGVPGSRVFGKSRLMGARELLQASIAASARQSRFDKTYPGMIKPTPRLGRYRFRY